MIKSSEDMILQTTSLKLSDVNAAIKQAQPQSEFDQLRSEIGSAFGSGDVAQAAPQVQMQGQGRAGTDDEFNQMFQQFEGGPQIPGRSGYGVPPVQPQITQPQPPKFQPRQFQQPAAQPIPLRPAAPTYPRQPAEGPKFPPDYSTVRSETQRFTSAPGAVPFQEQRGTESAGREPFPAEDEASFETVSKVKATKKSRLREDFDSFDDEDMHDDEFKKKSPLPVLIIVLLIIALGGAGAFIVYSTMLKKKPQTVASTVQPKPQPQVEPTPPPQIPVETSAQPSETEPVKAPEAEKEIVESKPEPQPTPPPVRRARPKPTVRRSTPPPSSRPEPRREVAKVNQVVFTSSPSGASITINDDRMGTTPYTWTKPFFGKVNVQISKTGYKTSQKTFEFTGGSMRESFTLEKEVASAPPPPPPAPVERTVPQRKETKPVVQTPPKLSAEEEDPFADIGEEEDEFALEPEPSAPRRPTTPSVTPSRETPTRPTAPSTPSGGGGEALIFIASIPPVADVYLNDKLIGKTNVSELKIPAGVQTLKFVKGGKEITKQLNLQPGKNPSQMVRIP